MTSNSNTLLEQMDEETDERTTLLRSSENNTHNYTNITESSPSSSSSLRSSRSQNTSASSDVVVDEERQTSTTPEEDVPKTQVFSVVIVLLIGKEVMSDAKADKDITRVYASILNIRYSRCLSWQWRCYTSFSKLCIYSFRVQQSQCRKLDCHEFYGGRMCYKPNCKYTCLVLSEIIRKFTHASKLVR